ncbi:hypothetical protein HPB52_011331 [Rhipicephalus sanguineus]|uniref:Nlr family card domain protein n=1 Tax=Rhipicephalus sanguineus TaxID=34632 RepID=A0A9D4PJ96_RHISA|nr:hypothetical protein HPB52_011331 [Rhipicephalus sanguineus]
MDPTVSAAAAASGNDGAGELGNLLVPLEGTRGYFSGSLIDYRMPCTASQDTRCQIVASIPLWNEFLCWLELELRELSEVGRQLGLVHVRNICHPLPTKGQMRQAAALLCWLLKTHRCVASVQIPNKTEDPEMANLCSVVLCNVLNGNDSVKSLALEISSPVQSEHFCEVLLSMKHLEELHCPVSSRDATFPKMISALLRASATLTVLDFNAPHMENAEVRLLMNALKANSTLRDLTLSSSGIMAEPESFVAFLRGTAALNHLRVVGSPPYFFGDDTLKWIFQGILNNGTISSLEAHELCLDEESVKLGARMLARSKVLRSFRLLSRWSALDLYVAETKGTTYSIGTDSWLGEICKNGTLEYMTLSVNIWTDQCWGQFFRVLSRHGSLKKVTIVADECERCRLADIAKKLEEIGCEEKVSFLASCNRDRFSLTYCKNYSELRAAVRGKEKCTVLPVYRELATFPPLTFFRLILVEWEKELCCLLVEYVSTTSTLQELYLQFGVGVCRTEWDDWWPALSQSLLRNRSITDLSLGVCGSYHGNVDCIGKAVGRSKTIRKIRLLTWGSSERRSFLRGVRTGISENYTLCSATLDSRSSSELREADWLVVCDTARRNSCYVARAAQFLSRRRCGTPCAAALDRVYRHPALVAELSKVLSISEADAVVAVRQGFRSIEGMHEFMRLAGVVKVRVTCQPRDDGRAQLDALDDYCWSHVRRYLQLDDVAWNCRSSTNTM